LSKLGGKDGLAAEKARMAEKNDGGTVLETLHRQNGTQMEILRAKG
jgi:hypothetical protein